MVLTKQRKRFKQNKSFQNVVQPERATLEANTFTLKGAWRASFFQNTHPIVLELGCGKGEYTVHLGALKPQVNHIGVDIKGARFWRGAKNALDQSRIALRAQRVHVA